MMDGKPDLRPCPFCGGYARLVRCYNGWVTEHPTYMVVCDKCTAQGLKTKEPEIVVKAWNRRAEPETAHAAPENRVLTLDELEAYCKGGADAAPVWIEYKITKELSRWIYILEPEGVFGAQTIVSYKRNSNWRKRYGTFWRCWLRKPTAEEMAHSPWGELPCTNH